MFSVRHFWQGAPNVDGLTSDVGQNCTRVQDRAGTDREEGQQCCRGNDTKDKGTGANGDGRKDEREAVLPSLDALTSSRTSTTTRSIKMSQLLLKHISSPYILSPLKFSPGDELKDTVPPPTSARKVSRIQLPFFKKKNSLSSSARHLPSLSLSAAVCQGCRMTAARPAAPTP